ncbi:hypothetical protein HNQ02_000724 [Flavobacterium sp. 7E]|uniref:hypothetical protein n=1 Tax=Flavobacterium sp. 7E TaxID=2735898 RepID=UPI00156D62DF|nr:hypothetical protein [Flavobacterium sp. 7E]NRS87817.1 hypothetical protein [Flavobacterium sp. 7E]
MKKLRFLVIGKNIEILNILVRLLKVEEGWSCAAFSDEQELLATVDFMEYDILLLSSGLDEEIEKRIQKIGIELNPQLRIILHYGGGSGLLKNEILSLSSDMAS